MKTNGIQFIKKDIPFWLAIALLLSPILFFPISTDLAIFVSGGKTIVNGGKLYVDFIDLKQPLVYYIFAFFDIISGSSEFGLRAIDYIFQFLTIIYLFHTIKKLSENRNMAFLTSVIYAITYACLNYNQTMQIESFTTILILFLINRQMAEKSNVIGWIFSGLIIGLLVSLKITFGIALVAVVFDDILRKNLGTRQIISKVVLVSIIILLVFVVSFFPLFLDEQVRHGYLNIWQYLAFYSQIPAWSLQTLTLGIKLTSVFFGDNFSLFLLSGLFAGFYVAFSEEPKSSYLKTCLIFGLILFVSVVIEKKFYVYHLVRMQIPLIVLTSAGLFFILKKIKNKWIERREYSKFLIVSFLVVGMFFSPIARWVNLNIGSYYYITDKTKYNLFYETKNATVSIRKQHLAVAKLINNYSKPGDKAIIMSSVSHVINYFLKTEKPSRFALSCFYFGEFKLPEWQQMIFNEIKETTWIVVQENDGNFHAFGNYLASFDMLKNDHLLYPYIQNNFSELKAIGCFRIYRRNIK